MPSTGPFARIDSPFTLKLRTETKADVTKSTGVPTKRSFTATTISGRISFQKSNGEQEELVRKEGLEDHGQIKLHTETVAKQGDEVEVHLDATGTNFLLYRIVAVESPHPTLYKLTGIARYTYACERTGR